MNTPVDAASVVVLSPHLDDAVLSCGALLAERKLRGRTTAIVTVFNGPPEGPLSDAAREFHERCGHGDNAMDLRQKEDDEALALVGAHSVRLSFPEALYRRDEMGQPRYPKGPDINLGNPEGEANLVKRLSDELSAIPAVTGAEFVLAPLSIGDHIDHQIVAAAARQVAPDGSILWYEDTPYFIYDHCTGWQAQLTPRDPVTTYFSESTWAIKLDAIACYRSQHQILWYRPEQWRADLTAFVVSQYGSPAERYWRQA